MEVRTKELKEVEVTKDHYYLCDKCGIRITTIAYDAFEFDFQHKTGESYHEGGSGEKWNLDLCQSCAPKAVKVLEDNGFKVQKKEWDW